MATAIGLKSFATVRKVALSARHLESTYSKYKTLDFEEPDNPAIREHYERQKIGNRIGQEIFLYVLAGILTIAVSFIYLALFFGTEDLLHIRIEAFTKYIEDAQYAKAYIIALATCFAAALIPALLVVFVAPGAIGSGMTGVISFLNGSASMDSVDLTTTVVRFLGAFGIVVSGLYSGIDGPMAQIGASVGTLLVRLMRKTHTFRRIFYGEANKKALDEELSTNSQKAGMTIGWKSLLSFLEQKKIRLFYTLGASASIAAVFRSPIGGVMFALEEATSYFEPPTLIRTAFCTVFAYLIVTYTVILGTAEKAADSRSDYNKRSYFSTGLSVHFPSKVDCGPPVHVEDFMAYLAMGILAAFLGTGWNWLLGKIQKLRLRFVVKHSDTTAGKVVRILEVMAVCLITTTITVLLPVAPGADVCTTVRRPVDHVAPATPASCLAGDIESFNDCLRQIDQVCLPTDLADKYRWNIVSQYLEKLSQNETTSALKKEENSSSTTENGQAIGAAAHRLRSLLFRKRSNIDSDEDATTAFMRLMRRASQGEGTEDVKKKIEEFLAPMKATMSTAEKMVPFYLYTKDKLQGNPKEGCYYEMRSLFYASPERQLKLLLKRGLYDLWSGRTLTVFGFVYVFLTYLTYYVALPTDLVIPNLIIGAIAGRGFGLAVNLFKYKFGRMTEDPGVWAMFGMAAFWSGTSRLVLTVPIVCLELTSDFNNIPGLLVVTLSAAWVARFLGPSLYHVELENNGAPFLDHEPSHLIQARSIDRAINRNRKLVWLRTEETLHRIREFANRPYAGFPVVDLVEDNTDKGLRGNARLRPIGYVLQDRLKEALFFIEQNLHSLQTAVGGTSGLDPSSIKVNVQNLMNVSPTIVREDANAAKVYRMMRSGGLRSVLVVDAMGFLVGIVTRKDILRLSHAYSKYGADDAEESHDRPDLARVTLSRGDKGYSRKIGRVGVKDLERARVPDRGV
ncbi:hypothetical protein HK102_003680 [Quaeritorhiza haematococci]|nr:hypothetical protein HK102_003680 [Quaeritorhiza haematococci]